jgi:hypothetical protein
MRRGEDPRARRLLLQCATVGTLRIASGGELHVLEPLDDATYDRIVGVATPPLDPPDDLDSPGDPTDPTDPPDDPDSPGGPTDPTDPPGDLDTPDDPTEPPDDPDSPEDPPEPTDPPDDPPDDPPARPGPRAGERLVSVRAPASGFQSDWNVVLDGSAGLVYYSQRGGRVALQLSRSYVDDLGGAFGAARSLVASLCVGVRLEAPQGLGGSRYVYDASDASGALLLLHRFEDYVAVYVMLDAAPTYIELPCSWWFVLARAGGPYDGAHAGELAARTNNFKTTSEWRMLRMEPVVRREFDGGPLLVGAAPPASLGVRRVLVAGPPSMLPGNNWNVPADGSSGLLYYSQRGDAVAVQLDKAFLEGLGGAFRSASAYPIVERLCNGVRVEGEHRLVGEHYLYSSSGLRGAWFFLHRFQDYVALCVSIDAAQLPNETPCSWWLVLARGMGAYGGLRADATLQARTDQFIDTRNWPAYRLDRLVRRAPDPVVVDPERGWTVTLGDVPVAFTRRSIDGAEIVTFNVSFGVPGSFRLRIARELSRVQSGVKVSLTLISARSTDGVVSFSLDGAPSETLVDGSLSSLEPAEFQVNILLIPLDNWILEGRGAVISRVGDGIELEVESSDSMQAQLTLKRLLTNPRRVGVRSNVSRSSGRMPIITIKGNPTEAMIQLSLEANQGTMFTFSLHLALA